MAVSNLGEMTLILVIILSVSGLAAILQGVNHICHCSVYARGNLLLVDIVVVILYLLVAGLVVLFEIYSGYDPMVIYAALTLGILALLFFLVRLYIRHPGSTNKKMLLVFLAYFFVVAYLTLFMRIGSVTTSVRTAPFDDIYQAFVQKDPGMATHFFLNVVMFLPFGYLVPATNPRYLGKWSFALMGGLIASTVIEGSQLIFHLGQSDVDDIIANTLGAVIGYVLVRFVWQVQKNWRV